MPRSKRWRGQWRLNWGRFESTRCRPGWLIRRCGTPCLPNDVRLISPAWQKKLPARRICSDEDVAALVLACMTNPALTGAVLKIDGGYTLV